MTTAITTVATVATTTATPYHCVASSLQKQRPTQQRRRRYRNFLTLLTTTTATTTTTITASVSCVVASNPVTAFMTPVVKPYQSFSIEPMTTTTTKSSSSASEVCVLPSSLPQHPSMLWCTAKKRRTLSSLTAATTTTTTTTEESLSSSLSSSSEESLSVSSSSSSFDDDDKVTTTPWTGSTNNNTNTGESKSLKHVLNVVDDDDHHHHHHNFNRAPWIVGHRGCLYDELENTRSGFERCAQMGCDAVELDVFLLKCNTLVVFHGGGSDENPGDLWDYCRVRGSILDYTYEEAIRQLTFNPNYDEFPCPQDSIVRGSIPTLDDVLQDAKKSGLHVKIELKGPDVVEPVLELVDSHDMIDQISFSSFDLDRLALLRKLRPDRTVYKTGALFNDVPDDFIEKALAVDANEIHLRYDTITVDNIQRIHHNGMGSMAWLRGPIGMRSDCIEKYWDVGNEDDSMYETMLRTGVQQICVNRPDVLIDLRHRLHVTSQPRNDNDSPTTTKTVLLENDVFQVAQ